MPMVLLRAYVRMLPQLNAERTLARISEVMVGTGSMEQRDAQRILRSLHREINGDQPPPKPMTEEERIAAIQAQGLFQVELVPVKPSE